MSSDSRSNHFSVIFSCAILMYRHAVQCNDIPTIRSLIMLDKFKLQTSLYSLRKIIVFGGPLSENKTPRNSDFTMQEKN